MVQYVEPSVTIKVWPGCIVTDLPFWLSPARMSLEGDACPCHGSAQLARHIRHMQRTQLAATTIARGQKALLDTPLFIAPVSPSYRPRSLRHLHEPCWHISPRTCATMRTRQTLLIGNKFQRPGTLASSTGAHAGRATKEQRPAAKGLISRSADTLTAHSLYFCNTSVLFCRFLY